jgi:hypothetical protein
MTKILRLISALSLFWALLLVFPSHVKAAKKYAHAKITDLGKYQISSIDTVPPSDVMEVINEVVLSTNTFNIDSLANLYTPNAVISDDDPPYSWNGPTAGIQWINAIEKVCKANRLTKLKGTVGTINVYAQTADNVYIVAPVTYTGYLPGKRPFEVKGAFTFVLRLVNEKWLIKSQTWLQKKAVTGQ